MDEEKVNKFKDVTRNCYPVMLFQRRIKTGVRIKIAPMDEKELVFKKNSCSHNQRKKELIKLFKGGLQGVQTPRICSKSRPKTMDDTNVLQLHFLKKKKSKSNRKLNYLHAGGGKVLASSSMFTSSELV